MSAVVLNYRGRQIRETDVVFLRELIAQNPALSRRRLSVKVCEAWQWVQPNGQPRDMVCRGLMLALHRAGHIELPAKRQAPPNNAIAHRRVASGATYATTALTGGVAALGPLTIQLVRRAEVFGVPFAVGAIHVFFIPFVVVGGHGVDAPVEHDAEFRFIEPSGHGVVRAE